MSEYMTADEMDVDYWGFARLRELGVSVYDAVRVLASGASWHAVEALIRRGCSPALAAEIVA